MFKIYAVKVDWLYDNYLGHILSQQYLCWLGIIWKSPHGFPSIMKITNLFGVTLPQKLFLHAWS